MVDYAKLLDEITKRFGSRPTGPPPRTAAPTTAGPEVSADEARELAAAEAVADDPPEPPKAVKPYDTRLRVKAGTQEIDADALASIFTESERETEHRGPTGTPARPAKNGPPFRNHAELLKFASGLIANIEESFKARARASKA
jgi:hypothetical protein